jgi:geranylgeranyl reductase
VNHIRVREKFSAWVEGKGYDTRSTPLESHPIACDFRGVKFGNIFLAGDAAGLASGFTGEGIYQSLASGQEVAKLIMDPRYPGTLLDQVLKYNRMLDRIMEIFRLAGPLKGPLQEFLVYLITRRRIREKVNARFS